MELVSADRRTTLSFPSTLHNITLDIFSVFVLSHAVCVSRMYTRPARRIYISLSLTMLAKSCGTASWRVFASSHYSSWGVFNLPPLSSLGFRPTDRDSSSQCTSPRSVRSRP